MLQRLRKGKDLKAIDKSKPKFESKEEADAIANRENEWFRENVLTEEQKVVEKKTKVEKGRYINALKALIKEKGAKLNPLSEDMPSLCSCGAQMENIRTLSNHTSKMSTISGKSKTS